MRSTDDEETHKMELAALAEKDPAFYKYLQENDKELLNFTMPTRDDAEVMNQDGGFALDGSDKGSEADEREEEVPILTAEKLKIWQKAILEVGSDLHNDFRDNRPPYFTDTFFARIEETPHCIPQRSSNERGR